MEVEEASASISRHDRASDVDSDAEHDDAISSEAGSSSDNDGEGSEEESSPGPKIDAAKARTKLHHVAKTLRATAKKTKTFEVQKLVKKLKGLQKKSSLAELAELAEKELAALKSIDIGILAGRALITKMIKAKLLPRPAELGSAAIQSYIYLQMVKDEELLGEDVLLSDPVVTDGDRAVERAKAKITSSKVLADQVGRFVDELKKLVGIEPVSKTADTDTDSKAKGKAKQEAKEDDEDGEEERQWSGSEEGSDSDGAVPGRRPLVDDDDNDDLDADEQELERLGNEKLEALGDLSQWDDLIGSDSVAGSDSEPDTPPRRKQKARYDFADDDSAAGSSDEDSEEEEDDTDSSSSSASSSSSDDSDRPRKRRSSTSSTVEPSKKKTKKASSTILPSLSTGFIAGRSDDEWSDAEADLADRDLSELKSGGKKERKNRMGQRARKALYEKKYGKNANHIKMREKQKAAKLERAQRPQHAVSQQGGRQRPPAFQAPPSKDGGWGRPVAPLPKQPKRPFVPRSVPGAPPKAAASSVPAPKSQEMHPSWIAKQKQKELMAQVKPQGKKVVFD